MDGDANERDDGDGADGPLNSREAQVQERIIAKHPGVPFGEHSPNKIDGTREISASEKDPCQRHYEEYKGTLPVAISTRAPVNG